MRILGRWLRRLTLGLLVLVLLGVVVTTGGMLLVQHYAANVEQADLLGDAANGAPRDTGMRTVTGGGKGAKSGKGTKNTERTTGIPATGPLNILLAGIDERADNPKLGARADSIIVVHVPASRDRAYLVSLPRDTRVTIPGHGMDKLNAAYTHGGGRAGGFELLALTVHKLTGLRFDAGAIVNFAGLRAIVDAVGGVELCVDAKTTSVHIGWDAKGRQTAPYRLIPPSYRPEPIAGVRPQVYDVGCRHFTGWEALDFVRQRDLLPDGDYGRQRHQQQLIGALAGKLTSAGTLRNPLAIDRTLTAVGDAVTFDGNGASVTDWILATRGISPQSITMLKTNGGRFSSERIDGQSFEILDDTSRELFAAAVDDRLGGFAAAHPDWVSKPGS